MLASPTSTQIASALAVVQSPDEYADQPQNRTLAWAILLANRGQRMNQFRIGLMQRAQRVADAAMAPPPPVQHIAIHRGA